MNAAPKDEVERGTMPKTAQEHGHEQIEVLTDFAMPIAAKRDIQIILEPRREADVPAPPELGDGSRLVRTVKVLRELETEEEGYADGHVGVAREVAVNLEGVAIDGEEILESAV